MIDFLKDWCLNIVTLVIFIVLLEMLLPSGKMKKMINLVSGLILVIALINPVLGLLKKGVDLEDFQMANSNFIDKKEIMVNSEMIKEEQTKQITNVYRNKVINQLEGIVKEVKGVSDAKADVIINEDYSTENFGEVKKAYITLKLGEDDKDAKTVKTVKVVKTIGKVSVNTKKTDDREKTSEKRIDNGLKAQIEEKIEKILNIQKENIIISLEEN
ncbi:stage III sporulation protein AF [Acetivibrio cellulolyticus]|uniref:stage III sporulation protein AF n=1 Tax=Acetivibrio cellulolyticus TaxID=35830 RepID=UPI0001E2D901|nr:stage III sporulation protein AF [Acetivibrio cellulolyticus]